MSRILTLTANTTIDLTVFVPRVELNRTLRSTRAVTSLGGKPTDASWILGEIGVPSKALGFAAGLNGRRMEAMLQAKGVLTDFDWVDGETRTNVVLIGEEDHTHTTISTTTMSITQEQVERLKQHFLAELADAAVVVLGGTLPAGMTPDFYTEMIAAAKQAGVPVVFDAAEPNLSAGLRSHPDYIKPNRDELAGLVGADILTPEDAYHAGREVLQRYGTCPIITLGSAGTVAVLEDRAYRIPPLPVEVVSAAGAGDGMLAGIAASIYRGEPIEGGLRLGTACASAVCLMPGTADCRREDVERFLPEVRLISYP
ncbi:1-phosphofructokinase family hexose kinase [Anaerolineae bacterium CFX9]|nr:1-phosphofructokinase family hexose kinase [Anaerolineae bacterium CFX9]